MAVNNNTTSLGDGDERGTIGTRNFSDYNAREISTNVSRHNYRSQVKSDKELNEFRQVVYKMVSGWSREDKILQITEYGDASQLQRYSTPSEEVINKILTESIIIHLDPDDLRRLRMDMDRKVGKIRSGIKKAEQNRRKVITNSLRAFNTNSFADVYSNVKEAKNVRQYKRGRRASVEGFRVPRYIQSQYGNLRKELLDVLKTCFNKVEILNLAANMDIEIPDGTKEKEIFNFIINKTCLYVDLIVGKSKRNFGNAIFNPEPYNELLQYTSYSYVTGKPGLDPNAWADLKRQARRAKEAIKERAKMQSGRKRYSRKSIKSITGMDAGSISELAGKIRSKDTGFLADADYEELAQLAGRYGINPNTFRNRNIAFLKARIYTAIASEQKRIISLNRQEDRLKNRNIGGRRLRETGDLLAAHRSMGKAVHYTGASTESVGGSSTPIVYFSADGDLRTPIDRAVPVYIVGQGIPGKTMKNVKESREARSAGLFIESLNSRRSISEKIDPTVRSKKDLSEVEQNVLNNILNLPVPRDKKNGSIDDTAIKSTDKRITSVGNLISELECLKIPGRLVTAAKIDETSDKDYLRRLAYLYAMGKGYKKLQDYLTNNYSIVYRLNYAERRALRWQKAGRIIGGAAAGIAGAGVLTGLLVAAAPIATLVSASMVSIGAAIGFLDKRIRSKNKDEKPTSTTQLNEKSRAEYNRIKTLTVDQLRLEANELTEGKSISLLNQIANGSTLTIDNDVIPIPTEADLKKSILGSIIAGKKTNMPLRYLFRYEAGIIDANGKVLDTKLNNALKVIERPQGFFRSIGAFFSMAGKRIGRFFQRKNKKVDALGAVGLGDPEESNTNSGPLFLPKIKFNGGRIDIKAIDEVLPVYVVNNFGSGGYKKLGWGSDGKNTSGGKITNRELTLIDYTRVFGADTVEGDLIKLKNPGDLSVANEADNFVGRKAKDASKFPKNGFYRPTKETIAWAIENNKQFANGGSTFSDTFITGDAPGKNIFAGGAKPELVQTFSKTPVMSKITPIKKFSDGGISIGSSASNISTKMSVVQALEQLGAVIPDNIFSMTDEALSKVVSRASKKHSRDVQKGKPATEGRSSGLLSTEAEGAGIKMVDTASKAMPVYITNDFAASGKLANAIDSINETISNNFSTLFTGLSTMTVAAPYGVGTVLMPGLMAAGIKSKVENAAIKVIDAGIKSFGSVIGASTGGYIKASTGGRIPRFATGGKHTVITGDAAGKNIFAGGAKPELVKSDGNMDIIPLNKTGREKKTKIDRMTSEERRSALATAISSHVIKFNYSLPDGVSEVSNTGEAIKVFNVKPGINDRIIVNGSETTLIDLLAGVQTQLSALLATSTTNSQLLGAIAAKPINSPVSSTSGNPNPFAGGFPTSLDSILGGN